MAFFADKSQFVSGDEIDKPAVNPADGYNCKDADVIQKAVAVIDNPNYVLEKNEYEYVIAKDTAEKLSKITLVKDYGVSVNDLYAAAVTELQKNGVNISEFSFNTNSLTVTRGEETKTFTFAELQNLRNEKCEAGTYSLTVEYNYSKDAKNYNSSTLEAEVTVNTVNIYDADRITDVELEMNYGVTVKEVYAEAVKELQAAVTTTGVTSATTAGVTTHRA